MGAKSAVFSLTGVLDAIDSAGDEVRWLANTETAEIVCLMDPALSDIDYDEEDYEGPEWAALPDRFDVNDWEIMRDFAYALGGNEGERLMDAIHGRGAFRQFRYCVEGMGALESWYAYKDMRHCEIALEWLEDNGLTWNDDLHERRKRDWRALLPAALRMVISLDVLDGNFSVCKFAEVPAGLLDGGLCFIAKTADELSVVCETERVGADALARDDGWRALKVRGPLDFGLVGIMAKISAALAEAEVPLFTVSTFDTDYILVKATDLKRAVGALKDAGCTVA